jgi:hypothetical protein
MAEKTEFVLGANFGTPYGSGSQLIFPHGLSIEASNINLKSTNSQPRLEFWGTRVRFFMSVVGEAEADME